MKTKRHQLVPAEKTLVVKVYNGAIIHGEFVKDSLIHWASTKKPGDGGIDDYHGNFDAVLFEKWFLRLCINLQAYGSCVIHMDGTRYHKRQQNPAPTRRTLKADIQKWLLDRVIPPLLALVKEHKPKPVYVAQRIAANHGHYLLYTPPYHPELQPIELVWGLVKNRIARRPAKTPADLSARLTTEFTRVNSKNWCKFYRRVLRFERKYLAALEECELLENEDEVADPEGVDE
ncbi:unnamed protein product [Phytophthora fragariaefolia]|uniref:Unnamed protein product n=1 Tax=Phytophthora fragariaefolia TaxID=1490495 RepID=A0A9W7DDT8_9STRA|nr:unnamed protein product [Phytophthora fragariaefolia]